MDDIFDQNLKDGKRIITEFQDQESLINYWISHICLSNQSNLLFV